MCYNLKTTCAIVFLAINLVSTRAQPRDIYKPTFSPGDSATIIVVVKNNPAPVICSLGATYIFAPAGKNQTQTTIGRDSSATFKITTEYPTQFNALLVYKQRNLGLRLFVDGMVIPKDTLTISCDYFNTEKPKITFSGKSASVCNYYKDLKFDRKFNLGNNLYISQNQSNLYKLFVVADSVESAHTRYLLKYAAEHQLPDWFIGYERENIRYLAAKTKLAAIRYNNSYYPYKVYMAPDIMLWLNNIKTDNSNAMYNVNYYNYLSLYFELLVEPVMTSSLNDFKLTTVFKSIPDIKSELKSQTLDFYIAHTISAYFTDISMQGGIDSVLNSFKGNFVQPGFYNFLRQQHSANIKSLEKTIDALAPAIGSKTPLFVLWDTCNIKYNLKSFKDKNIMLHFWSVGSKNCIEEIREVNDQLKSSDTSKCVIIHICLDNYLANWESIIKQISVNGIHTITKGNNIKNMYKDFGITQLPFIAIINKNQTLVFRKANATTEAIETFKALNSNL